MPMHFVDDFLFMQGSFLYHWLFVNMCRLGPFLAVFPALYVLSLMLTPFKLLFSFYKWSLALCLSFARVTPSGALLFMSLGYDVIVVELTMALSSKHMWSFWMHKMVSMPLFNGCRRPKEFTCPSLHGYLCYAL